MTNSVMDSGLPKVRSGRKGAYVISFFVFLFAVAVYIYSLLQTQRYQGLAQNEQDKITELKQGIEAAQKDDRFVKYVAAKEIVTKNTLVGRGDRLSRIMNVFAKLQQLGGANISFSDFNVDYESLSLKGTVSDLKLVYGSGGVIDTFDDLDFLQDITIPTYQKTDQGFTFSLAAKVLLKNVSN